MDLNLVFTAIGALVSIGIIYGTLRTQIKTLREEIEVLKTTVNGLIDNRERLVAVETKIDMILNHFNK